MVLSYFGSLLRASCLNSSTLKSQALAPTRDHGLQDNGQKNTKVQCLFYVNILNTDLIASRFPSIVLCYIYMPRLNDSM